MDSVDSPVSRRGDDDDDVLYYGEEFRLWAKSEYGGEGGYAGVYFKGRRRKSRTGQQPLAALPPLGPKAEGEFVESVFRCVDPNGVRKCGPVKIGEEVLLIDVDGHAWNTSTDGAYSYLAMRLRGEKGEMRVRFSKGLKRVVSEEEEESLSPIIPPTTQMTRAKSMTRLLAAPPKSPAPPSDDFCSGAPIKFGDAMWLISCPQHEKNHPGAHRSMRREHVLTNFKKESSSLLGGYVTVDPRGYTLKFVLRKAPPYIESLKIGNCVWYSLPWKKFVAFPACSEDTVFDLTVSNGGARVEIGSLEEETFWLPLDDPGCSVLVHLMKTPEDDSSRESLSSSSRRENVEKYAPHLASLLVGLVLLYFDSSRAARAVALSVPAYHAIKDERFVPLALGFVSLLHPIVGWLAYLCALLYAILPQKDDDENPMRYSGELAIMEWSEEESDKKIVPEFTAINALRSAVREDAVSPRWLEDGELLRFVRARKTLSQRCELFLEAMAWRRSRTEDVYVSSISEDPLLGSFGVLERRWSSDKSKAPLWWEFLSSHIPFQVYGADSCGLPITYIGIGRMDLSSMCREVGVDRLEQKIIMQNDLFLDMAREATCSGNGEIFHGGVFIIDLDGLSRKVAKELNIFKRVSAALKILHPERQRKTFLVRAPKIFHFLWKLIKPMLDQRILSKIAVVDTLEPLFDELGKENIPTTLGGTFKLKANDETIEYGAFDAYCSKCKKSE